MLPIVYINPFKYITNMLSDNQKNYLFAVYRAISEFNPFSQEVCAFIASQFALESNFGQSNLATKHNNHCGMKFPRVRPNLARGEVSNQFAEYSSLYQCVDDYVLAISYHRPLSKELRDLTLFECFISKWYCPERNYVQRVGAIYNQFIIYLLNN